jgi:hypothetical protein
MPYPTLIGQTAWVLVAWAALTAVVTVAHWRRL